MRLRNISRIMFHMNLTITTSHDNFDFAMYSETKPKDIDPSMRYIMVSKISYSTSLSVLIPNY